MPNIRLNVRANQEARSAGPAKQHMARSYRVSAFAPIEGPARDLHSIAPADCRREGDLEAVMNVIDSTTTTGLAEGVDAARDDLLPRAGLAEEQDRQGPTRRPVGERHRLGEGRGTAAHQGIVTDRGCDWSDLEQRLSEADDISGADAAPLDK
jgi:hypothetical protein